MADSIARLGLEEEAAAPPEGQPSREAVLAGKSRPRRRSRVRLDDAVTWFLAAWPAEGPRVPTQDTVRTYRTHLEWYVKFTRAHGKVELAEALSADVLREAFKAKMASKGRATYYKGGDSAAAGLAYAARKLARWLVAQGVSVGTLDEVKPPRPPERIQPRLRPEEFKALEQAALRQFVESTAPRAREMVARDLALLYFLADTGARCVEVHNMTVDSVDFQRGTVHLFGKGRKHRVLSIVDARDPSGGRTLRLLGDWIAARERLAHSDQHVFLWTSVYGRHLSRAMIRRILGLLCEDAGIDGTRPPHAFRRGNFTESYKSDPRSIQLLAARMGWSNKSHHMVSVYTRGAELELAADEALPSLASIWHGDNAGDHSGVTGPNVRSFGRHYQPILSSGVSPGVGEATARSRPPYTGDGTRAASVSPRRGSRYER
jgi:site-specific recombinase XerD